MKRTLFSAVTLILLLSGCSTLQKKLPGTYVENSLHDTLEIYRDNRYGYDETLMNGVTGWTGGNWTINKKEIAFTRNPRPLMGFHSKIIKDSASDRTVFYLFLGDTDKRIEITGASVYKDGFIRPLKDALISSNRIELTSTALDSIEINTLDYFPITLTNNLFVKQVWRLQIYPAERYYLLDKYAFIYRKKQLKNKNKPGAPLVYMNFKKISDSSTK